MNLNYQRFLFTVCCLLAGTAHGIELGRVEGSLIVKGSSTDIRFVYGKHEGKETVLLLTSRPLAASVVDDGSALFKMQRSGDLSTIEIRLDQRHQPLRTVIVDRTAPPINVIANGVRLTVAVAAARLIDATASASGTDYSFVVKFRAPISVTGGFASNPAADAELQSAPPELPPAAPARSITEGKPLPRGGGDAGAAYLAYTKAFRKGDEALMKSLMTTAAAKGLDQMAGVLPVARALLPLNIEVTSGTIRGDTATLNLKGTPTAPGGGASGTATMINEGGHWKFAAQDWPAAPAGSATPQPAAAIAPVTQGTSLPADGGAPGNAWREYDKAMSSGNVAGIKKLLTAEGAKAFDQYKDLLDLMKGSRGVNAKVVGGRISGDKATLQLKGSPATMAEVTGEGTATLVKEGGAWKIVGEEWTPKKR